MELVPVIVVDATFLNGAVAHELERIHHHPHLLRKTLMIIPEGPFHMQNMQCQIPVHDFTVCETIPDVRKGAANLIREAGWRAS